MITDVKNHLSTSLGLPDELLGEFVDSFMSSFDKTAEELKPFAEGSESPMPDWMEIRRITHTVKGYSDGVGAADLRALSDALNAAAHAQDAAACRAGAKAIRDLHARYAAERAADGGASNG